MPEDVELGVLVRAYAEPEQAYRVLDVSGTVETARFSVVLIRVTYGRDPDGGSDPGDSTRVTCTSGFVVSGDGHILTSDRVSRDALGVEVTLPGHSEPIEAEVAAEDCSLGLAVLRTETPEGLEPLPLADSGGVPIGEPVVALGTPYGHDHTVSVGVLSSQGRQRTVRERSTSGTVRHYESLMTTDAAINRSNEGGPLLDSRGMVIGVNIVVGSPRKTGFAIPSNAAREVLAGLIERDGPDTPAEDQY